MKHFEIFIVYLHSYKKKERKKKRDCFEGRTPPSVQVKLSFHLWCLDFGPAVVKFVLALKDLQWVTIVVKGLLFGGISWPWLKARLIC